MLSMVWRSAPCNEQARPATVNGSGCSQVFEVFEVFEVFDKCPISATGGARHHAGEAPFHARWIDVAINNEVNSNKS
jgi:hypothetical protein